MMENINVSWLALLCVFFDYRSSHILNYFKISQVHAMSLELTK